MSGTKITLPVDSRGQVITGAMGLPQVKDSVTLISATVYADVFDLSAEKYKKRVFTGIAVRNLSAASTIELALGGPLGDTRNIVVGASEFMVLDDLLFGPAVQDESEGTKVTHIRAKLGSATGTAHSGTIDYSGGGTPIQPTNGMCVLINGYVYEFSDDASKETTSDYIVTIGASADASWTNLKNKINDVEQAIIATINTGTDIVTLTSVAIGSDYASIGMVDGDDAAANLTGATFSVATLAGGSGGITPVIHIW